MPPAGAASAAIPVLEVSGQGGELLLMLFPHLRGLRILRVEDTGEAVAIPRAAAPRTRGARGAGSRRRACTAATSGWWRTARQAGGRC